MSTWGPTPEQERWIAVANRLRGLLPRDALAERAGGWKVTGPYARIALFVLGLVAAAMFALLLGFGSTSLLLVAGAAALGASEWLKATRRLHASGFEEGLHLGGTLMLAIWIADRVQSIGLQSSDDVFYIAAIAATAASGLRLLNPFLTTCAALIAMDWIDSTAIAHSIDGRFGRGLTALAFATAVALAALAAGAREIRRPSLDRMLDWLVVALPVAAYLRRASIDWSRPELLDGSIAEVRPATCLLLAVLVAATLYAGLKRRRHTPLLAFLAGVLCLAVELRWVFGGSLEARLIVGGLVTIAISAWLERLLREPRRGITSTRLSDREGPLDLLQSVGAAVLVPATQSSAPAPYEGQGGRFGGGGASGSY